MTLLENLESLQANGYKNCLKKQKTEYNFFSSCSMIHKTYISNKILLKEGGGSQSRLQFRTDYSILLTPLLGALNEASPKMYQHLICPGYETRSCDTLHLDQVIPWGIMWWQMSPGRERDLMVYILHIIKRRQKHKKRKVGFH